MCGYLNQAIKEKQKNCSYSAELWKLVTAKNHVEVSVKKTRDMAVRAKLPQRLDLDSHYFS